MNRDSVVSEMTLKVRHGKFRIPDEWICNEKVVVFTALPSGALWLGPESVYAEYRDGLLKRTWPPGIAEEARELLKRVIIGNALEMEFPVTGYLEIPDQLREVSGIKGQLLWKETGRGVELSSN
jgi:DNA-binding transcriptional regulator/RsmH inhibitor MraZ